MTNKQYPAQFDWATELSDAEGHVTLSVQEAKEIGARLRSMGEKLKAYEDLDEAASDVQLLRMGYAAARLEIESLQARIKTMAEEHADELMVAHLDGRMCGHSTEPAGEYPALPDAAWVVVEHLPVGGGWVRHERRKSYNADQMRAYADATCAMRAAQPAGAQQPAPPTAQAEGWTKLPGTLPKPGTPVLLDIGKEYPIRAMWAAKHALEVGMEDDSGFGEYDEATDTYYCPEGWYEWNEHEEKHWAVDETPTAWCELPPNGGASHGQAPAQAIPATVAGPSEFPHEQMDVMALARYKVMPSHESMLHRHAVVAGDGSQQLYIGREVECENMARKFAGAFLDGAFAFHSMLAAAPAQPAPQQEAQEPYSIDVDPQGIRALVADAITGALAFGAQGANPPPTGHWLAPFWEMAREEVIRAARAPADSVLEDAARESEYRRGYRHGYEQRDAEVRGALA